MEATELIIGKRYWLDSMKDVSGVFIGKIKSSYCFNDLIGNNSYGINEQGNTNFSTSSGFYEID